MKKEVITCDKCGKALSVFNKSMTVLPPSGVLTEIDLCDKCKKKFKQDLIDLYSSFKNHFVALNYTQEEELEKKRKSNKGNKK